RQRVAEFADELRRGRLEPVPSYELSLTQFWQQQREAAREYFRQLKDKWPRRYLEYVGAYEHAHENHWRNLPCKRDRLPLNPTSVAGLPRAPQTLPPHVGQGGRPRSDKVHARNEAIREELKRYPRANQELAKALDSHGVRVPDSWRRDGVGTYMKAYRIKRDE